MNEKCEVFVSSNEYGGQQVINHIFVTIVMKPQESVSLVWHRLKWTEHEAGPLWAKWVLI